ncbi:hypothetical protein AMJ44_01475 [candidate division WOR-1 bacterium DG_54_3]|uniref:Uncharacterized protein n=1 Tax=candidate division WOR-1 bacterium DG_54_3 TaxID=1703775 RepID=A0A0S7Y7A4_UNCSA|nr:MAG: hypothetical protein AMJ44_01475 [candidate division WOR-1 bacterium DG_54_3]
MFLRFWKLIALYPISASNENTQVCPGQLTKALLWLRLVSPFVLHSIISLLSLQFKVHGHENISSFVMDTELDAEKQRAKVDGLSDIGRLGLTKSSFEGIRQSRAQGLFEHGLTYRRGNGE